MFDFLHLPELTDKYLKSLLFVFSFTLLFFGADCWLLTKQSGAFKKDIKLVDFFISRLRLLIPLAFLMFCIFLGIYGTIEKAFFYGAIFTSAALYMSVFFHRYLKFKSLSLVSWLALVLAISVFQSCVDKYPIGSIAGFIVFSTLILLIINAIEKTNTDKEFMEEQKKTINKATDDLENTRKDFLEAISFLQKSQPNLKDNDIRIYFLQQINNVLLDTAIGYRLSINLCTEVWWKNNIPDCPESKIPFRIANFQKYLNLNLIYLSYSLMEDAFRQLIREVNPEACKKGTSSFQSIYLCLLKELNVMYDKNHLELYRIVRNCQHNNGFYYDKSSETILYREVEYNFHYGKKVDYPNGLPILPILSDLVKLYVAMVESERLEKIPEIKEAIAKFDEISPRE